MSIGKLLKRAGAWTFARAKEPNTWAGLATIGAIVGGPGVASTIGLVGSAAGLILGGVAIGHPMASSAPPG